MRVTSIVAGDSKVKYFPGDDWRIVWQEEIDQNRFSCASVAIAFMNHMEAPHSTAVLLDATTVVVPGVGFHG